ncbi:MAG: hypothetical protein ACLSAH_18000 [Bilophila wadsworthia]
MPYIMAVDLGGTNYRFAGFTLDKGILSCTAWASAKRRNSRTRAHSSAPAERPWIGIPAPPTRSSSAWLAPSPIR